MGVPVVDAVLQRRDRVRAVATELRARYEWLDHLSRTGERYFQQRGNHFAAAVTFFSVLTAVPLLMVAFGVAGSSCGSTRPCSTTCATRSPAPCRGRWPTP